MSAPRSPRPTSLPKGVTAGALGARIGAYLLDAIVFVVVEIGIGVAAVLASTTVLLVVGVLGGLIALAWAVVVWWRVAVKGASPGMSVTRLELIGHRDGKPIGWGRALLRALIFVGLGITGIGLVIMVILMVMNPLRQGWHDLAVEAVVIGARTPSSRPAGASAATADRSRSSGNTVGLPAHLTSAPPSSSHPQNPYDQSAPQNPYGQRPGQYGQRPGPYGQSPGQYGPNPPGPGAQFGQPLGQPGPPSSVSPTAPSAHSAQSAHSARSARSAARWNPPAPPDTQPMPTQPMPTQPMPTPASGQAMPSQPMRAAGDPSPMDSGNEATHLVAKRGGRPPRGADQGWTVNLDDGRQVAVSGLVLLGRDPAPRPGEQGADLVVVTDNSRTVSKTHIAVGVDNKGIFVMDRGSTNGSAIATPSGKYEPCAPGEMVRVREGQIISFGDHRMEIRRSY